MLKLAKAVNPSPAMLVISNPKGAKRMAAKKEATRKTASRKAPVKAKAVTRKTNPTGGYTAKKKAAPKRKATQRRSNPGITSGLGTTAMQAINTVLGMTALGVVSPMLPQVLGPTPIGRAAQIGGLGWLGGYGLKRFGFGKAGDAVQLGGAVLGASILIESYVAPMIRSFARPNVAAPTPAPSNAKQLNGFYVLPQSSGTSLPPARTVGRQSVPLASRTANGNGAGVQGMMVVPRY